MRDLRTKANTCRAEWMTERCVRGARAVNARERKNTIRHFCVRFGIQYSFIAIECEGVKRLALCFGLLNQSMKGSTLPASPVMKQRLRNNVRGLVWHWKP